MIDLFQALVLAFIQGLTEFLPISSSAHLVVPSLILAWPDQGLAFDVAVHVGTLAAVMLYFRQDLRAMTQGLVRALAGGGWNEEARLVCYLAVATVPVTLVGLFAGTYIEENLRSLPVIASTTVVFGRRRGVADRPVSPQTAPRQINFPRALLIGLGQALAPVPGVSRSGITITMALLCGLDRQLAARFSFLLSIPAIGGAGLFKGLELGRSDVDVQWQLMIVGSLVSALVAYSTIALFLRFLDAVGMAPFVYYRLALGGFLYLVWWF
jgi:undecaprenyl-diphosphatase